MNNTKPQAEAIAAIDGLISKGYAFRRKSEPDEARKTFLKAVNDSKDLEANGSDAQRPLAEALRGLGQIERDLGEIPASLQHYREAAQLYRALKDPLKLAHTVRHVADILRQNGDPVPAAAFYDEALLIYRDQPETKALDLANMLRGYALLNADTGHAGAAVAFFQEARELYAKAGFETGQDLQPALEECDRQIAQLTKASTRSES